MLALVGCQSIEDAGHLVTGSVSGLRPSAPVAEAPRRPPPARSTEAESTGAAEPLLPLTSLQQSDGGQTGSDAVPEAGGQADTAERQPPSAPPAQGQPPVAVQPLAPSSSPAPAEAPDEQRQPTPPPAAESAATVAEQPRSPPVALAPADAGSTRAATVPDDRVPVARTDISRQPPPSLETSADVTAVPKTATQTAARATTMPAIEGHVIPASILDGDTFRLGDRRIRLQGIDAPELEQICQVDGEPAACGQDSRTALIGLTVGALVQCERMDVDAEGRDVSRCSADGVDVGAAMVRSGHAVAGRAASADYAAAEANARAKKYGVWRGTFQMPWDWRAEKSSKP